VLGKGFFIERVDIGGMPRDVVSTTASIYLTDIDAGNKKGSCSSRW
jgi:hypothetical protein